MAMYRPQMWHGSPDGYTRADRMEGGFEAYIPDFLRDRHFSFSGAVTAEIADATQAITALDNGVRVLRNTEVLARLLLRAEAVASSRIEGLQIGARKLLREEAQKALLAVHSADTTASEILANIDAMSCVVFETKPGQKVSVDTLKAFHHRLMPKTPSGVEGGVIRCVQNWIGGNSFNPFRAQFIPPPASEVLALLEDLVWFCNQDSLPAVAQAAIAHAQFETIHPFEDGNGRTGRALIHMILRRRGLVRRVTPPVSLVLATRSRAYVAGLQAMRYIGTSDSSDARRGTDLWVSTFAGACCQAIADSVTFETAVQRIACMWRQKVGKVRKGSATDLLLEIIVAAPVMTVQSAAARIGRSFPQTNDAIARLVHAGVLSLVLVGKRRQRIFEAKAVIDTFRDLERRMASPLNDTRVSRPIRPVPGRKNH